ncbi:MAG: cryptochrome/photolyase family protein [Nocardioidaceae bacterium]
MSTSIALFTRNLRVHDNPVLMAAAQSSECVVPLFVHDTALHATGFATNVRAGFLTAALADLDGTLRSTGVCLIVRHGDLVEQVCRLAEELDVSEVHMAFDVSDYAQRRQQRLANALTTGRRVLRLHDDVITVVAPGRITPTTSGKDHFAVFTPYLRRWLSTPRRRIAAAPNRLRLPSEVQDEMPPQVATTRATHGYAGESEALCAADRWLTGKITSYHEQHDDLAADSTSHLSPYLHFGCLSPLELVTRAADHAGKGAHAFIRQLAWRDFHHQVLAARPKCSHQDYRTRGDRWRDDPDGLQAWKDGRTGIPIIDAGMRQLGAENWMHNRARLITASFLTKTLYLDWRVGAAHFLDLLVDGDIANNNLNWQWVAGTGTDTRPNRVLNPLRQADRYDPTGDYIRRWVPELADITNPKDIHQPWRLGARVLRLLGYPPPIVELDHARDRFQHARQVTRDP